jgi:hypothetical protein
MQKLFIQNRAALTGQALFDHAQNAPAEKVSAMVNYINQVCDEREAFEAQRERVIDGVLTVGQSPDIKQVQALKGSVALARLCLALGTDPRSFIHPRSQTGGKSSTDTENLKGLKKVREVAETVLLGGDGKNVGIENVLKVLVVCMDKTVQLRGTDVIERKYAECYLNSSEYRSIAKQDKELFDSVEAYRAKQMTGGGAKTQVSQVVRMLAPFGAVEDVQDGRAKNIRFNRDHPLVDALLIRLGFRTVVAPVEAVTEATPETVETAPDVAPVEVTSDTLQAVSDALEVMTLEALDTPEPAPVEAPKRKRNRK